MVDTREVDHLEGERLLVKVVCLAEGDVEPDVLEGHNFLSQDDPIGRRLAGAHAAPWDAHPI